MNFEHIPKPINDKEKELLKIFGGDTKLREKIVETLHNNKEVELYTPQFAKTIAKEAGLPDNVWFDLMKLIQKVYPPLEEDYNDDNDDKKLNNENNNKDKEKEFSHHREPIIEPWQVESAARFHKREAKRRGLSLEDYEYYNDV